VNTAPIRPARIACDPDGTPRSLDFGDIYHPREGARSQARHVFLAGNDLPARWAGRERFVVLETGFGLGNSFLATWEAWKADPERCKTLVFISIEARPPTGEVLTGMPRDTGLAPLAAELAGQWPPLTWNLHRLDFERGAVQLSLAFGDVAAWLPQLTAEVDAFFLDGFAPAVNPGMWDPRLFKAMARLAGRGATAATWTAARPVRDGLRNAGFEVRPGAGVGHKRDITLARFAPRSPPRRSPRQLAGRPAAGGSPAHPIVVVGAGLAGCALASALAEQGRHILVLERRSQAASEGSGNPAGILHGVVHAADNRHARFYRAATLAAQAAVQAAIEEQGVAGSLAGLLRLEHGAGGIRRMQAVLDRLGLPGDYVQALDVAAAAERAGVPLPAPAWYYPQGGWVDPGALARSFLVRAGDRARLAVGCRVAGLRRNGDRWTVLDAQGGAIAEAAVVVLANASEALGLLGSQAWPLETSRGQLTGVDVDPGWTALLPRIPVAGAGYVLPPIDGKLWCGASSQGGVDDRSSTPADHRHNLERLRALLGPVPSVEVGSLAGRAAFRCVAVDRLPVIGAVPSLHDPDAGRLDQPRLVPREPGLFVFTALGSRGIATSVLGARMLAAAITGAPSPVETDLLDAVDPARFQVRTFRRGAAAEPAADAAQPPVGPMAGSAGA
jgi:tRNA 5-methylaminomethyl-2-thiouridine biosynthesis bifunctional protein